MKTLVLLTLLPCLSHAGPYYEQVISTTAGTSTMTISGYIGLAASSTTPTTYKIRLDGTTGDVTLTGAGVVGSPTGGNKGAGSINAQSLYINGAVIPGTGDVVLSATQTFTGSNTMSGPLTLSASTLTVTGNAFSVGTSTFNVFSGKASVGGPNLAASDIFGIRKSGGYLNINTPDAGGGGLRFSAYSDNSALGIIDLDANTGIIKIGAVHASYFPTFWAGNAEKMRITTGGNVGIGDAAPQAKLVVNGNIVSSGTITATAFVGDGTGITGIGGFVTLTATQTFTGINTITPNYAVWIDSKAAGVAGGGSLSDDWHARDLTVELADTGGIGTLTASSVTLAAGTYFCEWSAPFYGGLQYQTRLRNVTAGTTLQAGQSGYCDNTTLPHCISNGMARFVLTGSTDISIQYIVAGAKATNGLGFASSWGEASIFSILKCTKER